MEYDDPYEGYDPDGYGDDPYLESILERFDRWNQKKQSLTEDQAEAIIGNNYDGRVEMAGEWKGLREVVVCYCSDCHTFFKQTGSSLVSGDETECQC